MTRKTNVRDKDSGMRFLVLLHGTLEFDGRARRMIEVLTRVGRTTLVDLGGPDQTTISGLERVSLATPALRNPVLKHLCLGFLALRVALRVRPDVVVAQNFLTTWSGWLLSRIIGAALIYDAYELVLPTPGRRMSFRDAVWYMLERLVVRQADLVIAANRERAELMADHYALPKVPVYVRNIPPVPQLGSEDSGTLARFPVLHREKRAVRRFIYQGYLSFERGIARFVEALAYLPPEYQMVIVGDGPAASELSRIGKMHARPGQLLMLGRVPQRDLHSITLNADVGIVTYSYEDLNNIYCAPNKLFEYAHAGLPVVATDQMPLKTLVESYDVGIVVGQNDTPREIAELMRSVYEKRERYACNTKKLLEENRWEVEADRLLVHLNELIRGSAQS